MPTEWESKGGFVDGRQLTMLQGGGKEKRGAFALRFKPESGRKLVR